MGFTGRIGRTASVWSAGTPSFASPARAVSFRSPECGFPTGSLFDETATEGRFVWPADGAAGGSGLDNGWARKRCAATAGLGGIAAFGAAGSAKALSIEFIRSTRFPGWFPV
jgi:hypothetical protein